MHLWPNTQHTTAYGGGPLNSAEIAEFR